MPSIFTHAISAIAIGGAFKNKKGFSKMLLIGAACSMLPDADVISFAFGIPYQSLWGHRGITHSFFFAALLSMFVVFVFYSKEESLKRKTTLFFYFFFATSLHPLLDACTNGGLGVAFFAPFLDQRYFFPFRPIRVSPIGAQGFFTERGWEVFKNELLWVWFPAALFMLSATSIFFINGKNKT